MKLAKSDITRIVVIVAVFAIGLTAAYYISQPQRQLPIYNPSEIDSTLVAKSLRDKGSNHRVLPFKLVNQNGDTVTEKALEGQIYIADFFYTTCPGICKDMAKQKRRLQKVMKGEENFRIVSHTVMPEVDSVPMMKKYAEKQGADVDRWLLLTGAKKQIYKLARESYFAVKDKGGDGGPGDFIHTENFVLIDPQKRIRGYYNGTSRKEVSQLIEDYKVLKKSLNEKL